MFGKKKYTVVGYDKDNDVYVVYDSFRKFDDAVEKGRELGKLVKEDKLRRENGEPIDWIQVYANWNTIDETAVWGSFLEKDEEDKVV